MGPLRACRYACVARGSHAPRLAVARLRPLRFSAPLAAPCLGRDPRLPIRLPREVGRAIPRAPARLGIILNAAPRCCAAAMCTATPLVARIKARAPRVLNPRGGRNAFPPRGAIVVAALWPLPLEGVGIFCRGSGGQKCGRRFAPSRARKVCSSLLRLHPRRARARPRWVPRGYGYRLRRARRGRRSCPPMVARCDPRLSPPPPRPLVGRPPTSR